MAKKRNYPMFIYVNTDRIEWEQDVVYEIELLAECTTSDAQGIMEATETAVEQAWIDGKQPKETAQYILSENSRH